MPRKHLTNQAVAASEDKEYLVCGKGCSDVPREHLVIRDAQIFPQSLW